MNSKRFKFIHGIIFLLMLPLAHAQPQVNLSFESMFGQFGFYQFGVAPNGFNSPTGISFIASNDILIADQGNLHIQRCNLQGECSWIGGNASAGRRNNAGTFDLPHGVEADRNGLFAVADEDNHAVQLCDFNQNCVYKGESISRDNPPSSGLGRWAFPDDVAFNSGGFVYGLDTGNNRIQVLKPENLDFSEVFGSTGSNAGQFNRPKGIAIDSSDMVYIADTGNNRIQICNPDGSNCSVFGSQGSAPGQFDEPIGIEVDNRGLIWIADTGNNRIQVCDKQGACQAFGSAGTGEGQFDRPTDVAVSSSGRVGVVDTGNNRIQFFSTGPFQINAGLNDAWFDPDTDGQGFFITVFPDLGLLSLAWFTYDTELPPANATANLGAPGHRWLTALGPFADNQAVLKVDIASGGIFDTSTNITHRADGTITLTFEHCDSATVDYNIPSINRQGSVPVRRVVGDNIALCQTLQSQ